MENESIETANRPPVNGTATNEPEGEFDWSQRAGPIFKYGLVVGFTLILLGGVSLNLSLTNVLLEILVICAGLSIILGAFGSTAKATIPGQSIVLVGVASLAVALFILLMQEMDERYVHVQIEGDVKGAEIEFVGDDSYLGSFQQTARAFHFVIFGKEIDHPLLKLYITLPDETELAFECIHKDNLRPYLGSGKTIVWRFDNNNGTLMNSESGQQIASLGHCLENNLAPIRNTPVVPERPSFSFSIPFISTAYAQSEIQLAQNTKGLIDQLNSNAGYLRRETRSQLADKGVPVVKPLLAKLSNESISYRSRLGVIVALTEMMRKNKQNRTEIINNITHEDLVRLVDAAADNDRTIRIYASEFLYDLGDPRAIQISLDRFSSTSANGRYNLLLVIKGATPFASAGQRAKIIADITALKSSKTPKTNDLIDSIVVLAGVV